MRVLFSDYLGDFFVAGWVEAINLVSVSLSHCSAYVNIRGIRWWGSCPRCWNFPCLCRWGGLRTRHEMAFQSVHPFVATSMWQPFQLFGWGFGTGIVAFRRASEHVRSVAEEIENPQRQHFQKKIENTHSPIGACNCGARFDGHTIFCRPASWRRLGTGINGHGFLATDVVAHRGNPL